MKPLSVSFSQIIFALCLLGCDGAVIQVLCAVPGVTSSDGCPARAKITSPPAGPAGPLVWSARVESTFEFPPETEAIAPPARRWKSDPHFVTANGRQHFFFSGSDARSMASRWSLSVYQDLALPTPRSESWELLNGASSSGWDRGDLVAPFAVYKTDGAWSLYYAASGDPDKPDYVLQVGRSTSPDLKTWARESKPVIATPSFASGVPSEKRPDAYGATDPWVFQDGSDVYLYYAGLDCVQDGCRFQILRSRSLDGGATFPPGDVVLSGRDGVPEEAGGVAGPSVIKYKDKYLLLYTRVQQVAQKRRESIRLAIQTGTVGMATSDDGKEFRFNIPNAAPLVSRLAGPTSYRSEGIFSPSLFVESDRLQTWLAGSKQDAGGTYFGIVRAELLQTPEH